MKYLLHSKKVGYAIHATVVLLLVWFLFPNIFTKRDMPVWPILANMTVEGVDRNKNNLRDDVEIRIHRKVRDDQEYLRIIAYSAAVERRIHFKANTRSESLEFFRNEDCNYPDGNTLEKYVLGELEIVRMVLNTQARIDKSNQNVMFMSRSGDLLEYACGSTYDLSEVFEKYSLQPKKK